MIPELLLLEYKEAPPSTSLGESTLHGGSNAEEDGNRPTLRGVKLSGDKQHDWLQPAQACCPQRLAICLDAESSL